MSIIFYNIIKRSSSVSLFNVEVVYELYNWHEPMIELSFLNIFYVNRVSFIYIPLSQNIVIQTEAICCLWWFNQRLASKFNEIYKIVCDCPSCFWVVLSGWNFKFCSSSLNVLVLLLNNSRPDLNTTFRSSLIHIFIYSFCFSSKLLNMF